MTRCGTSDTVRPSRAPGHRARRRAGGDRDQGEIELAGVCQLELQPEARCKAEAQPRAQRQRGLAIAERRTGCERGAPAWLVRGLRAERRRKRQRHDRHDRRSRNPPTEGRAFSPAGAAEGRALLLPDVDHCGVISRKQILLLLAPAPLRIVSRPSLTATVDVPSIQRVDVVGVPLTIRTPSTVVRNTLSMFDARPTRRGRGTPVRYGDLPDRVGVGRLLQVRQRVVALVGRVRGVAIPRLRRVVDGPAVGLAVAAAGVDEAAVDQVAGGHRRRPRAGS